MAEILGLAYHNTVLRYQQRYSDMPKPVFDPGKGRVKLWLRSEITAWSKHLSGQRCLRATVAGNLPGQSSRKHALLSERIARNYEHPDT